MTFKEIFNQLEGLGTEQNRKIYMRHGSGQNTYGVSFANLRQMAKGIGRDHEIAVALWESENVDAQALATMIADPEHLTFEMTDEWMKGLTYSTVVGLLAGLVAKTNFAKIALEKWTKAKKEHVKEGGYALLSRLLKNRAPLEQIEIESFLDRIENEIHDSPNRARVAMNDALIAVGAYREDFTDKALNVARRIGAVRVDHGETSCKTPDAASSIERAIGKKKNK